MNDEIYYHNDEVSSSIIIRCVKKYVRGHTLEVGAGVGMVTRELSRFADSVLAIEPSRVLFQELAFSTSDLANVKVLRSTTDELISSGNQQKFDSLIYLNVLEHIENDTDELKVARKLLNPDGHIIVVVPAHQWLFAPIDRLTGHFRRYSKASITKVIESNFNIVKLWNFDSVALLPYWMIYTKFGSTSVSGLGTKIYSKILLRLSLGIFLIFRGRVIGKNLILIASPKQ